MVFAAVAVLALCAPAAAQPAFERDVVVALDVRDGVPVLQVASPRRLVVVRPQALRFSIRPYAAHGGGGPARPIGIVAGPPVYEPRGPRPLRRDEAQYRMALVPLSLPAVPPPPGMYELLINGDGDVVRSQSGAAVRTSLELGPLTVAIFWPDERDRDAALHDVRARFANRVVHGYGGISAGCPGSWSEQRPPQVGVRLAGVTRAKGTVAMLRAGSVRARAAATARSRSSRSIRSYSRWRMPQALRTVRATSPGRAMWFGVLPTRGTSRPRSARTGRRGSTIRGGRSSATE